MTKKIKSRDIIKQNKVFAWIAVATLLLLMIPFIAMQYDTGVEWSAFDFTIMTVLIFGCASGFVLVARRVSKSRRVLVALAFAALFMYIWAELAVGVFLNLGS